MYTTPPKKMLGLNILKILQEHTDAEHRLTQKQIIELLATEYQMEVDRKAVRRNLTNLIEAGYDIECSTSERRTATGESEDVATGWYLNREFEDSELRLLIDSLLFSHQIPTAQRRQLIDKLKGLSNRYFDTRVNYVHSLPEVKATNKQLFYTIEVLDEAIGSARRVSFNYGRYDTEGVLQPRLNTEGEPRRYTVDPYQLVATNGRYYLICRVGEHTDLSYYRVDRILNIELAEELAYPLTSLPGLKGGLDLPVHLAEHVYMFAGPAVRVRFSVKRESLMHVFDWFGSDIRLTNKRPDTVDVSLRVNEAAMRYWALQFFEHIEILEPASLRSALCDAGKQLAKTYR